jgi:hypothetical protein
MNKTLARTGPIVTAAPGLTSTVATPALASADNCKGDAYAGCMAVNDNKPRANSINSRVALYVTTCRYGHSQVLINGMHYADPSGGNDKDYYSTSILGAGVTTGIWNVNRDHAEGIKICSTSWRYSGSIRSGTVNGYQNVGTACATIG